MKQLPVLILVALTSLIVADGSARAAGAACDTCKARAHRRCTLQYELHHHRSRFEFNRCVRWANKACAAECQAAATSSTPAVPVPSDRIEDQPCYAHCASICSGPNEEAHRQCVIGCLEATARCTPGVP